MYRSTGIPRFSQLWGWYWIRIYFTVNGKVVRRLWQKIKTRILCISSSSGMNNCFVCLMVFNATFNNILFMSWRSVLLVGETGVPGENHRPVASHRQTLSHTVVSSTPRHERGSNSVYLCYYRNGTDI